MAASAKAGDRVISLYEFGGTSGDYPAGGVITDRSGAVFGTNESGGNGSCDGGAGCGTIFALSPPAHGSHGWTFNVLYNFQGDKDGYSPLAQLTLGPNGSLYGYTAAGSDGTVFQLVPPAGGSGAWTFQILYVFTGHKDGNLLYESSPLMRRGDSLYGIASGGSKACGAPGCGSVFRLKPPASGTGSWSEKTLYEFVGGTDSGEPNWIAGPDSGGSLYLSTSLGNGAVVEVSPPAGAGAWNETVLTSFNGGNDGSMPGSLVLAQSGTVYGVAAASKAGLAFQLTPPGAQGSGWTRTTIAKIAHGNYGPSSLAAGDGATDGVEVDGGHGRRAVGVIWGDVDFFPGAVFQLTPRNGDTWSYSELCNFNHGPDRNPVNVVTGRGGNLFGVLNGGDSGFGGLFEVR